MSLCPAPCLPDPSTIAVEVECDNDTALVGWAWSDGASSYELTAISDDGFVATCASQDNYCNFTDLVCGQTYNLSLTAINSVCQDTQVTSVTFETRESALESLQLHDFYYFLNKDILLVLSRQG